jgi:pyruvyltransferase
MRDYVTMWSEMTGIQPTNVLEIGSRDGHDAEYLRDSFSIDAKNVHVVEPNPDLHIMIENDYPEINLHKFAISKEEGVLEFNKVNTDEHMIYVGQSSLLNKKDGLYERINSEKIKVQGIAGKTLLEKIGDDKIYLCKIDVEGLTYEVLESFGDDIEKIKSFHLECEHVEVWENQKVYRDIVGFMHSKGYLQVYFRYVWNSLKQSDSIWIHKNYLGIQKPQKKTNKMMLYYYPGDGQNFGDILGPYIARKINANIDDYAIMIGSILQISWPNPFVVWGPGIIGEDKSCRVPDVKKIKKVYAVRGPKTREVLLGQGIECPEIYGDPALILPYLIPKPKKQTRKKVVGILPHWVDLDEIKNQSFSYNQNEIDLKIIDIRSGIEEVIHQTTTCDVVITSSLHGLILGESYNIPTAFTQISKKLRGGTFKFEDYFESTGRSLKMLDWKDASKRSLDNAIEFAESSEIPDIDIKKLVDAFPFVIENKEFLNLVNKNPTLRSLHNSWEKQ